MNGLEQNQVIGLIAMLEQRKAALEGQAVMAGAPGDLPVSEIETSPADKATVRLLNDLALEAAGHNAAQLLLIKHALAKVADGSYGLCEVCGESVGFSRLEARPEARLCINCQTRAEKR